MAEKMSNDNQFFHFFFFRNTPLDKTGEIVYNVKEFGDLVNTVAPVHIRQDSVAHNLIAKFVKMDGEAEDFCAYGDALMYAGVKLKQAFGGTGYNEQIRHFPDFASRMYFMEQMND